jgi:hypothetical protein
MSKPIDCRLCTVPRNRPALRAPIELPIEINDAFYDRKKKFQSGSPKRPAAVPTSQSQHRSPNTAVPTPQSQGGIDSRTYRE